MGLPWTTEDGMESGEASQHTYTLTIGDETHLVHQSDLVERRRSSTNSGHVALLTHHGRNVIRHLLRDAFDRDLLNPGLAVVIEEMLRNCIPDDVNHLINVLKNTTFSRRNATSFEEVQWSRFIVQHPCHWDATRLGGCFNLLMIIIRRDGLDIARALENMPRTCFPNGQVNWESEMKEIDAELDMVNALVQWDRSANGNERGMGEASLQIFYFIRWLFPHFNETGPRQERNEPAYSWIHKEILVWFPAFVPNFLFSFMKEHMNYVHHIVDDC